MKTNNTTTRPRPHTIRVFALLSNLLLLLCTMPLAAAPGGQGKGRGVAQKASAHSINKLRTTLRKSGGGLSKTDKAFIAFVQDLDRRGIDIVALLEAKGSFLTFLLDGITFGSLDDPGAIERFVRQFELLVADGSLSDNDRFILDLVAFLYLNHDDLTSATLTFIDVLKKLAAAGVDLPAYTAANPSLVSSLLELANRIPPIPIPQKFCDLIDELAADGTLDSNDLFTLTFYALSFGNTDGTTNAANDSLVVVLRKLADAGVDLAAFTRSKPRLVSSLYGTINSKPRIPIPQEFCDLIDELAADGTLDANDLFILSLYAATIEKERGATAGNASLVDVLQKLDALGIDLASLDPSLTSSLLFHVFSGDTIPQEFCDLLSSLAADGSLDAADILALSFVAIILEGTGDLNDQAIVFAEIISTLADAGLDVSDIFSAPDSFLSDLFEAVQGHELSLAEIQDILFALENFLIDGELDPFEKEILRQMVEAAEMP